MQNIFDTLTKISDENELYEKIDEFVPEWIIGAILDYSDDYPHLKHNWEIICQRLGVTPQKIILVTKIPFDPDEKNTKEIALICEILVRKGYVVRRSCELFQCKKCRKALLPKNLYEELPRDKIPNLPDEWNPTCRNC
jgi:hypothetical protein